MKKAIEKFFSFSLSITFLLFVILRCRVQLFVAEVREGTKKKGGASTNKQKKSYLPKNKGGKKNKKLKKHWKEKKNCVCFFFNMHKQKE